MKPKHKTFLGIIPARGGSKGIKNKNIKPINGLPLIAYSILAARKSKLLKHTIVSTDSKKIAAVAEKYGGAVPFMRPPHLAVDQAPTMPVLQHALLEYERQTGLHFDYVVLLQPTTPLRLAVDIDRGIHMLMDNPHKDNLLSVFRAENIHPKKMYVKKNERFYQYSKSQELAFRRQDAEDIHIRNGAVYIVRRDLLFKGRMFADKPMLMVMPKLRSVDIDSLEDFYLAEIILKSGRHRRESL